ncbi:tRNA(Ile)-lysidine synthase [Nocardioides scoriae]|uniref:tRNA(Ile)-lysidine synthase n=1 Tax=Nocardioides scoriae TaxID=642780 RepID=A0A1H1U1U7_9ACTN|nr:tRNA lysidine(34) synthetase TilS [Nocardioides scoriae]SDS66331.1 tRNA(Ile)-lysidine synthase [Nocardioides scoriae]
MALHPAVAAVRLGVRRALSDLAPNSVVLVACSGGADSLALVSAAVAESRRGALRVVGATVDHGLQEGSAAHATRVVEQMAALGADETVSARVAVEGEGMGPEAAAREARYSVLGEMARHFGAAVVLLGHTLDDQAETVLLGLARGAGARSLAGMRRSFDGFRRPLLDVTRLQTETACLVEGLEPWTDPHNSDERFTRVRVRTRVLPLLEDELGPGVAATLARTADQLRVDTAYLDEVSASALASARLEDGLSAAVLADLHAAVRLRVLRSAALEAGALPAELATVHLEELDALVTRWHGQQWVDLPGHLRGVRAGGVVRFEAAPR